MIKYLDKFYHALRYSLSLRLLILFVLTGIAISAIFQFYLVYSTRNYVTQQLAPHLDQYIEYVLQDIGNPPSIERAKQLSAALPLDIQIITPSETWASAEVPLAHFHEEQSIISRQQGRTLQQSFYHGKGVVRIQQQNSEILLWSSGFNREEHFTQDFLLTLIFVLLTLLLLYGLIWRLFNPLKSIQSGIQRIGAGELHYRIENQRHDELGDLAKSINQMAGDIEQMLEAKRELLLAISHELRSPLTRAKVSLALLPPSNPQMHLSRDLVEMEKLISELLESERLKDHHKALNLSPCQLNDLVLSVLNEHFQEAAIELVLAPEIPLLPLDSIRIKLGIKNLLDNALKYQKQATELVLLQTHYDEKNVELIVQDNGEGIAPEHLPHLTEPFYRADPSRQRSTGGFGLGLYLVKLVAEAHQGTLRIESILGKGTCITLSLPVRAI